MSIYSRLRIVSADGKRSQTSECHVLNSGTHCEYFFDFCPSSINLDTDFFVTILGDFSVTGFGNSYSDCVFAMSQLAYFCPDTGGLKTVNGHQYKLDPNDGGSC
jgi:hypothetical protein